MSRYEFIGAKSGTFTTEEGKKICYAKMCVRFPFGSESNSLDGWCGSNWDVLKVPYDYFNSVVNGLKPGDQINVMFDRNGRVDLVEILDE